MSIHFWKSVSIARQKGAFLGALDTEQAKSLGDMSKRELIEIALRLAALQADNPDDPEQAFHRLQDEAHNLKANGII